MHSCDQCGTTFTRKNNLTPHKEGRCRYVSTKQSQSPNNMHAKEDYWWTAAGQKDSPFLSLYGAKPPPVNPKMQALLDEIVDDGIAHTHHHHTHHLEIVRRVTIYHQHRKSNR